MLLKKILVPIDGSLHAERALTYALGIAERCNADVEVLTVVPEVVSDPEWMKEYTEKMKEEGEITLLKAHNKTKEEKPDINITVRLEEGHTALKILEIAEKGSHDIIIMGSRGLGSVRRFLLGSIGSKVVNQAEIPVLIVK